MTANRFLPAGSEAAAEIQASHEVMDLVRGNTALSFLVVQLRHQSRSWRDVQAAIEAKIKPMRTLRHPRQGNTPEGAEPVTPDRAG
jgi:hypothetical protein